MAKTEKAWRVTYDSGKALGQQKFSCWQTASTSKEAKEQAARQWGLSSISSIKASPVK